MECGRQRQLESRHELSRQYHCGWGDLHREFRFQHYGGPHHHASTVNSNILLANTSTVTVGPNSAVRTATFLNNLSLASTTLNMDLNSDLITSPNDNCYAGGLSAVPANFAVGNAGNFRQTFSFDTTSSPGQVLLNVAGSAASTTWVRCGSKISASSISTTPASRPC